jgi:integrase
MKRPWIEDRRGHAEYRAAVERAKGSKRTPPGRWRVRWYDPQNRAKAKTFARLPEAERFLHDLTDQLNGNTAYRDPNAAAVRFATVAEDWAASKAPTWAARTRTLYRDILDDYLIPTWGPSPVSSIGFGEVASWLAELSDPKGRNLGASRVHGIHTVLSGVLSWAVRCGHLAANPITGLDTLPAKPGPKRLYLTHEQVDQLAAAAGALETAYKRPKRGRDVYRVMAYTLAYCGLRIGEALALRVESVDLDGRQLHVVRQFVDDGGRVEETLPKGGKSRVVGIPSFVALELRALTSGRGSDEVVFPSPEGGPMRAHNFRERGFRPAVAKAKLPKAVTPHTLRHTFASLSVAAGADVKTLQAAMGHATASMTLDVYADLFPARVGEVADALDAHRAAQIST